MSPLLRPAFLVLCLAAGPASAEPRTPPPGDPLRAELLDAVRPFAVYDLGAPVEFEVFTLLVEGDRAFAQVRGQRPGGVPIDLAETPMVQERYEDPSMIDGPRMEVFLVQEAGVWRVVTWSTGATDAWYWGYDCANYAGFFPEVAC